MPLEGMPTYILQQAGIQMQIRERELAVPAARGNGDQSLRIVLSGAERLNLPQVCLCLSPRLSFKGKFLYTVVVCFHMEWRIRKPC